MRLLGRPIGVWIALAYLLGLLALAVSDLSSPIWSGSPLFVLWLAAALLSVILLFFLNRWAVLTTAVMAVVQAAFYLVYLLDPPNVVPLLGLGSPAHDVYVLRIQNNVAPLLHLAASAAIPLYLAWLWGRGVLR